MKLCCHVLIALGACLLAADTRAQDFVIINELFNDPPEADITDEYIEFRGTPNMSLNNYYLIGMENENGSATGTVGSIEFLINLSGRTVGTNGFLTIRENGSPYTNVAPGTNDLVNSIGEGYGSFPNTSVGAEDENGDGVSENSGATYFLIKREVTTNPANGQPVNNIPFIGLDLDGGNNGLDRPFGTPVTATTGEGRPGWRIVDSIGYFAEGSDANGGRLLAKVNYGPPSDPNNPPAFEPSAVYSETNFGELEYVGRYGSSTGSALTDWFAANITNNPVSGFTLENLPTDGYRISGPHTEPLQPGEISRNGEHGVANEGAIIMTLGRPNWPVPDGDLNQDLVVDQADLDIVAGNWQQNDTTLLGYWLFGDPSGDGLVGPEDLSFVVDNWTSEVPPAFLLGDFNADFTVDGADYDAWKAAFGTIGESLAADGNGDGSVDAADYVVWRDHLGSGVGARASAAGAGVPEPATVLLAGIALGSLAMGRRRQMKLFANSVVV